MGFFPSALLVVFQNRPEGSENKRSAYNSHSKTESYKERPRSVYACILLVLIKYRKHGIENFSFEIIEEMTEEYYNKFSNNREEYWIIFYDALNNGYNETAGGEGGLNQKALEKTRKLSIDDVKYIRQLYLDKEAK